MATNRKEFEVFTKRNILKEINSEKDPTKKAALRKERTAKIKVMKFLGDSRADKFAADKEMMPMRKMPMKAVPKAPASMPAAMRTVAPKGMSKASKKAPAKASTTMPAAIRMTSPKKVKK